MVLGPYETRGINLLCRFPVGSLRECFVTLPNRQVTFIVKTDGVRIWGALKNFSAEPQQLMPHYDLLACRATVDWFRIPDKGVVVKVERPFSGVVGPINAHGSLTFMLIVSETKE